MAMNNRILRPLAGFEPRQIAGLIGWWDSADNSKITTDTGVSAWQDKSGNGYTLTQSTGANQPTLSSINGRQAFAYNGSSQFLESAAAGLTAWASGADRPPLTFFVVLVTDTDDAARNNACFASTTDFDPIYNAVRLSTSNQFNVFYRNDAGSLINLTSTATYSVSVPYVLTSAGGENIIARANGTEIINAPNTVTGPITCNSFSVGALRRVTITNYASGQIGDVLIYNRVLSAAEITRVERWLAGKFGVTLA